MPSNNYYYIVIIGNQTRPLRLWENRASKAALALVVGIGGRESHRIRSDLSGFRSKIQSACYLLPSWGAGHPKRSLTPLQQRVAQCEHGVSSSKFVSPASALRKPNLLRRTATLGRPVPLTPAQRDGAIDPDVPTMIAPGMSLKHSSADGGFRIRMPVRLAEIACDSRAAC
jgi:hypothetical protein